MNTRKLHTIQQLAEARKARISWDYLSLYDKDFAELVLMRDEMPGKSVEEVRKYINQ